MSSPVQPKSPSSIRTNFTRVPNSVIEFQNSFPPAELRLVLMVLMWPGTPITDQAWKERTGLDPRMKLLAIKGLKEKGLNTEGKGDKMTFSFDLGCWDDWHARWEGKTRARTIGRAKSVTAKPGMQVHQDCLKSGCSRLCAENTEKDSTPFLVTKFAKYISQTGSEEGVKEQEAAFQQLLGIYLSVGVELCEADVAKCGKLWDKLQASEQAQAVSYAGARASEEWATIATRYIPRPWNYLAEKHWNRKTPIPGRDKSQSRGQRNFEAAAKRFMEEE